MPRIPRVHRSAPAPRLRSPHDSLRRSRRAGAAALLAAGLLAAGSASAAAQTVRLAAGGTVIVSWRGNGHGHGLSQYGARGAALEGRSYQQILAFYYPHTRLVRTRQPTIRVLLSDFGSTTTVAASPKLKVTGVPGVLPSAGVARYRLVANSGHGLTLQQLGAAAGSRWRTIHQHVGNQSGFYVGAGHSVRIFAPNGTSNLYRGEVRAVRRASVGAGGVDSVNVLGLERYVAGVAPREMPASWSRAAVDAQAVAARTYAYYELEHPRSRSWDICDTTDCQFYGGYAYLDAHSNVVWRDDTQGVDDTADRILTYGGQAIFAQFSASDGGWTVAGGQPYLVARSDPYDSAISGDPYLARSARRTVASLARYVGLSAVTSVVITRRDGHGAWGGRVLSAWVVGTRAGKAARVAVTGADLQEALGADTSWLTLARG